MSFEPTSSSSSFTSSSRTNSCEYEGCSSPELDVVSFTPGPQSSSSSADDLNNQKRYFCQRCLNHGLEFPRKGHKPFCRFAMCHCEDCMMVEYRRRLNNQLSQRRLDPEQAAAAAAAVVSAASGGKRVGAGKKIRDPKCARCSAHGEKQALRGHKKALCPYLKCGCHLCNLVENRRSLMAKQIKLRRDQQKARRAQPMGQQDSSNIKNSDECNEEAEELRKTEIKEAELTQKKTFTISFANERSSNITTANSDGNNNNKTATKQNKGGFQIPSFARPFVIGALGNRKRSYGSTIDGEKSRQLSSSNNNTSYSTNSSPVLNINNSPNVSPASLSISPSTMAASISPMLLPPSLLYQQLCMQSQQRKQQMTDNNSAIMQSTVLNPAHGLNFLAQLNADTLGHVATTSSSDSQIFNHLPFNQTSNTNSLLPIGTNLQSHANLPNTQALVNSMLLVNNFASSQPCSATANLNANFGGPSENIEMNNAQNIPTNKVFSPFLCTASTAPSALVNPTILNTICASGVQENNTSKGTQNCALMMNALNFISSMPVAEDVKKSTQPKNCGSDENAVTSGTAFTAEFMEKLTMIMNASTNNFLASKPAQPFDDVKSMVSQYNFEPSLMENVNGISTPTTSGDLSGLACLKETLNTPFANLFLHYSTVFQDQRDAIMLTK